MSVRLYVGNLPKETVDRNKLQEMFVEMGEFTTKVIKDRKTGKCRGFAFVTVPSDEKADEFIEKFHGQPFMEQELKIEKALPRAKDNSSSEESSNNNNSSPSPAPASKKGGGSKKNNRRSNNNSNRNDNNNSVQPDPRWADALAELKERLTAAQSSNS